MQRELITSNIHGEITVYRFKIKCVMLLHKEYSFSCKLMLKFNTEYFSNFFNVGSVTFFMCVSSGKECIDKGLDRCICV